MARSSDEPHDASPASSEDDLGRLIRWSLNDLVSGAEPSAGVWTKIASRLREPPAPTGPWQWLKRSFIPLVPMLQAAVISVLLLAFGLGVDRNASAPRKSDSVRYPTPTVLRRVTPDVEGQDDMLRGYMLVQRVRVPVFRPKGHIPEGDTVR